MTFSSWLAQNHNFDIASLEAAEQTHDRWITRLVDLAPAIVLVSRPVTINDRRLNEGFIWDAEEGYLAIHHKYYMPNDEGWWRFLSFVQFRLTRNRFYAMGWLRLGNRTGKLPDSRCKDTIKPYLTLEVDLEVARAAKHTYTRNVFD